MRTFPSLDTLELFLFLLKTMIHYTRITLLWMIFSLLLGESGAFGLDSQHECRQYGISLCIGNTRYLSISPSRSSPEISGLYLLGSCNDSHIAPMVGRSLFLSKQQSMMRQTKDAMLHSLHRKTHSTNTIKAMKNVSESFFLNVIKFFCLKKCSH